jgi:hypothetical protein
VWSGVVDQATEFGLEIRAAFPAGKGVAFDAQGGGNGIGGVAGDEEAGGAELGGGEGTLEF